MKAAQIPHYAATRFDVETRAGPETGHFHFLIGSLARAQQSRFLDRVPVSWIVNRMGHKLWATPTLGRRRSTILCHNDRHRQVPLNRHVGVRVPDVGLDTQGYGPGLDASAGSEPQPGRA